MDKLEQNGKKRVLVVDDSAFMRKLISDMIEKHPSLTVAGIARNGFDAINKTEMLKPDVITMDIEMPQLNGLEALRIIMDKFPTPVVMLSSTTETGTRNTVKAMEYGAFDFVAKIGGPISLNLHEVEEEIITKVVAASKVSPEALRRPAAPKRIESKAATDEVIETQKTPIASVHSKDKKISKTRQTFVIIGTSTGGPRALQEVLTSLPENIPAPILVVQHMPPNFTKSLADRLDGLSEITVKEAEDGEAIHKGTAYIAPGGKHLKFEKSAAGYVIRTDESELPRSGHRPSVDVLLESAAEKNEIQYVAVIMTGMGSDGKDGMEQLRNNCTTVTIAESAKTAVVYGMPKAIAEADLSDYIVDVDDIAGTIMEILQS